MPTPKEQTKNAPARANTRACAAKPRPHAAPPTSRAGPQAAPARKAILAKEPSPVRRGTKTAKILDLLRRPSGATLKELMKTTQWQAHSVRGFLSGILGKKMGTPAASFKTAAGERAYRLSSK
jgi:hypothetical protein